MQISWVFVLLIRLLTPNGYQRHTNVRVYVIRAYNVWANPPNYKMWHWGMLEQDAPWQIPLFFHWYFPKSHHSSTYIYNNDWEYAFGFLVFSAHGCNIKTKYNEKKMRCC